LLAPQPPDTNLRFGLWYGQKDALFSSSLLRPCVFSEFIRDSMLKPAALLFPAHHLLIYDLEIFFNLLQFSNGFTTTQACFFCNFFFCCSSRAIPPYSGQLSWHHPTLTFTFPAWLVEFGHQALRPEFAAKGGDTVRNAQLFFV